MLGELPEEIKIEQQPSGKYDFAHLFAKDRAELQKFIDQVLAAIQYDAILWISYPKGSSGVKTDLICALTLAWQTDNIKSYNC